MCRVGVLIGIFELWGRECAKLINIGGDMAVRSFLNI